MVQGGSAWQLLGSERWAQARSGASWGPADEHEPHTGAGTAGSPGRPRAAPSGSAPRGSSSPSPPPPAPSGLPRPPLPAPAGAEGRSGHGRRRRRRQRWVSARGARRSGTRRDRTCPERQRQRGRGGGRRDWGMLGEGREPRSAGAARIGGSGSGAAGIEHRSSEPAGQRFPERLGTGSAVPLPSVIPAESPLTSTPSRASLAPPRGDTGAASGRGGGVLPGGGEGVHIAAPNPQNAGAHLTSRWCCVHRSCSAPSVGPAVPCPSVALCCVHRSRCAVSVSPAVPSARTQPGAEGGPAGKPLTGLLRRSETVLQGGQGPHWGSVLGGSHGRHSGPAARTGAGRCCSGAVAALTSQRSPQGWCGVVGWVPTLFLTPYTQCSPGPGAMGWANVCPHGAAAHGVW